MALPEHGANPHHVYEKLGIGQPAHIIDYSENVNPAGPPKKIQEVWAELVRKISDYPDPAGEPFLSAAAKFHEIQKASIFAGNGAAELLSLIAERYRGKKAIIVHPTFSEYETTLNAKGVEIIPIDSAEEDGFKLPVEAIIEAMHSADVLYLCTPNNPTGVMPTRDELNELIHFGAETDCEIVLDEAFIDFIDEAQSFISELIQNPHVIVVRSMTKMYAIPGIRLGYVVANPSIINEIEALAPHWNVNGIAAQLGAHCLQADAYRERAIQHSNKERIKMKVFLRARNCIVAESEANFISFTPGPERDAGKLYRYLLERGMVLRHSENFRGMDGRWLRIGMKSESDMDALKEELSKWFAAN